MRTLRALLRRPRHPAPRPVDAERLLRIYRETQAEMEQLRRAA